MSLRIYVNVVRCWNEGKKRRSEKCLPGLKGVGANDLFYVEWRDPAGRRKMQRIATAGRPGKLLADQRAAQLRDQLTLGQYDDRVMEGWKDFRKRLEEKMAADKRRAESLRVMSDALNHVERLLKPQSINEIDARAIERFKARRQRERGKAVGSKLSSASLNKELRLLKRALRLAERWGYLDRAPHIEFAAVETELPRVMTPQHFAAIYAACESATMPEKLGCNPADWWRALLYLGYTSGWRISEMLSLRRADVDMETGQVKLLASNTKNRKPYQGCLLPDAIGHLRKLPGWGDLVLDWPHDTTSLYREFRRIQKAAGISLTCSMNHVHDSGCRFYSFHDLRRAFATLNVSRLSPVELQKLMRHANFSTTLGYINMAGAMQEASSKVFRPNVS